MWSEHRLVRKDATIRLYGGAYQADPALAGRKVECVFDPFDLTVIEIRWNGTPHGHAVPRQIGRHSHPKAKPEAPAAPPPATGIDYLGIIGAEHEEASRRHRIRYDALAAGGEHARLADHPHRGRRRPGRGRRRSAPGSRAGQPPGRLHHQMTPGLPGPDPAGPGPRLRSGPGRKCQAGARQAPPACLPPPEHPDRQAPGGNANKRSAVPNGGTARPALDQD